MHIKPNYGVPPHLRHRPIIGKGKKRTIIQLSKDKALKVENKKFLFRRPNRLEWENYQRYFANVPRPLRRYFATLSRNRVMRGGRVHQIRIVKDFDGAVSRSLRTTGPIQNEYFWKCFAELREWLRKQEIPFYDFSPRNILVKKLTPTNWIPVVVDYELVGSHSIPLQFLLRIPFFSRLKSARRADRLVRAYRIE